MRSFLTVLLLSSLSYAAANDSSLTPSNRFAINTNLFGPAVLGASIAAEYGSKNAISLRCAIGNTSIPANIVISEKTSFSAFSVFLGYAHYYDKTAPLKGFFLRPSVGAFFFNTEYADTDNVVNPPQPFQHKFNYVFLTLSDDIGYRWVWKNGILLSLGATIGGAFRLVGKENAEHNYQDKNDVGGPTTVPYGELILELGYIF